ncbi:small basic family protein [Intestinimonas massiliensis (ex Afouda et al. 2020)]|uniref:small basic family protein n=1 Tax=Intestinimonas massiliensis (ex Afouda et al. 2020) TaxID=1673721 RepID=UPI0010305712|nr:small basic family protein [Intestinimonas massiliensis (ex Afouda et al. 2020)]
MLEIIGLLVGLAVGLLFPWTIPSQYSLYAATGLLAALDSALGGLRGRVVGDFKLDVFLSGTIGNAVIAVFLTWLGRYLGIPLYLAAVVVFGTRMFQNFAEIRRELLTSKQKSAKINQDVVSSEEEHTR